MKKIKIAAVWLMLLCIAVAGVACSNKTGNLRIDAPAEIQEELGTYAIPEYDVVNEDGVVMAGYRVKLVSVKDANGSAVEYAGGGSILIDTKGVYTFEYSANVKGIANAVVKVDFADRIPPTVQISTDGYPGLFITGEEYRLPNYSFGAGPDLSKCWMKTYHKSADGIKTEKQIEGLFFTVTEESGAYEFVVHGEDAAGNVKEVTHEVSIIRDGAPNIALYAGEFGVGQITASSNLDVTAATDTDGTSVLKMIVKEDQTGDIGTGLNFKNVASVSKFDYLSFDVRASSGTSAVGYSNPYERFTHWGGHYANIGAANQWKRVTFGLDVITCWYFDNVGTAFMGIAFHDSSEDKVLAAGTTFEIKNIYLETAEAHLADAEYNIAVGGAEYTFPASVVDKHERYYDGVLQSQNFGVQAIKVVKDEEEVPLNADGTVSVSDGTYTVYYNATHDGNHLFAPEYSYTLTVKTEVSDFELVYDPAVTSYTVSEALTVKSVTLNGTAVECNGNTFTLGDGGNYVVTVDAFGQTKTFNVHYFKPATIKKEVAVYSEIGDKLIKDKKNVSAEVVNDSEKGKVLKFTVTANQTGTAGTGALFENLSSVKDYDYISFDIKASDGNDVHVAFSQDGYANYGDHYAAVSTSWQRVSFALEVLTTWYQDNGSVGLVFFKGANGVLGTNTTFEITDIVLEKGNAQLAAAEHNVAKDATYTFPTTVEDTHIRYYGGASKTGNDNTFGVKVTKVMKGNETVAENAEGLTSVEVSAGTYTVYYKVLHDTTFAFHTEYNYTLTVTNTPLDNAELYYGASEEYMLPTTSIGGKTVTVTGVTSAGGGTVSFDGGKFSLTAGTPTTANDTNTYVYTVNYTVDGDNTPHSYTVTYRKPSSVTDNRAVYLDTDYGLNHQVRLENATAERSSSHFVQASDNATFHGTQSIKLTVTKSGTIKLHFTNVVWKDTNKNFRFAFLTDSSLMYKLWTEDGKLIGSDGYSAFTGATEGNTVWHSGFAGPNDTVTGGISSFTLELISYQNGGAFEAGTEILVGGINAYDF